jgi:hypothetical protein
MAAPSTARQGSADHGNGNGRVRDLALAPPGRRVRPPELAVGLLVTLLFALGGVLWYLRSVDRVAVLAVASGVERGEVIDASDLRIQYVSSGDTLAALTEDQAADVVGGVALVDLLPGTLMTPGLVAESPRLSQDEGVVGIPVEPGGYPAFDLAPGDRVNVVAGGRSALVASVEVVAVQDLAGGERKLVSLRGTQQQANAIAVADPATLRLVLVSS